MGRKGLYKVGACERQESCVGGSGYASVWGRVGGRNNNRPNGTQDGNQISQNKIKQNTRGTDSINKTEKGV